MSLIGTFETSRGYARGSGFGGQADVERKHPEDRVSPMALIKSAMRALCVLLAFLDQLPPARPECRLS
jgi:hypothetical protein